MLSVYETLDDVDEALVLVAVDEVDTTDSYFVSSALMLCLIGRIYTQRSRCRCSCETGTQEHSLTVCKVAVLRVHASMTELATRCGIIVLINKLKVSHHAFYRGESLQVT